jgi:hypothetical protein
MTPPNPPARTHARPRSSHRTYRWIRQLHLWIGAWGAIAAIIYGYTGLVMNHRMGDNAWSQGDSTEAGRAVLDVPVAARASAEDLSKWLLQSQGLDAQTIRKGPPRGGREGGGRDGARDGRGGAPASEQWSLSGGNARDSWSLQYKPGDATAEVKHSHQSWLAAFNRLHKTAGGGFAWVLLSDSFAIAMLLLGLSGIWMWARGRTPKQLVLSVFAASLLVMAAVLGPALA